LSGEKALAIGWLELSDGKSLLFYRQIREDCAIFFLLHHRVVGSLVNLISQRWVLHNRQANVSLGRNESDYSSAQETYRALNESVKKKSPPDSNRFGTLGEWHWVSYYQRNGRCDNVAADSELDFFEKVAHIETVKAAMKNQQALPEKDNAITKNALDTETNFQPKGFL
jgi:hypothetical protein